MFSEVVMDHVTRPRCVGPLAGATHCGVAGVPGEGPYVVLEFVIASQIIQQVAYQTYGCPAAIASASMTAQLLTGRTLEQALRLEARDLLLLLQGLPEGKEYCPVLAVEAVQKALRGATHIPSSEAIGLEK